MNYVVPHISEHQVDLWKKQVEDQKNAVALSSQDEIENYVLSMIRGYFRTTKKATLHLDSSLDDHGLDSLDKVELCIQVEDELGYLIDGEKLALFHKPKHFVNFINQMEGYRTEFSKLPHEGIQATYKSDF